MNTLIKSCMDILSCDTSQLKQSTIKELENIILEGLTKEKKEDDKIYSTKENKEIIENITIENIKIETCKAFNISLKEINSMSRKSRISYTRQVAMYLSRKHLNYSYPCLATIFNRKDHTTIMHGVEKIKADLLEYSYTRTMITKIERELLKQT